MADHLRTDLIADALTNAVAAATPTPQWSSTPTGAVRADSSGRRNTSMKEVFLGCRKEGCVEQSAAVGGGPGVAAADAFTGTPRAVAGCAKGVLAFDRAGFDQ
jgi:hypothetical protein